MSRGVRKPTLRDFTREQPSREDAERFRNAMNANSDLVTAMLQSIEVDYLLEQALVSTFIRQDQATINLLGKENAPLSTFFSKITLGYAMGLFDEPFMEYLHTIRRIRNAFAHARKEINFSTLLVRNEMTVLKLPPESKSDEYKHIGLVKRLTSANMVHPPEETAGGTPLSGKALTGRAAFVILCLWVSTHLRTTLNALLRSRTASVRGKKDGEKRE